MSERIEDDIFSVLKGVVAYDKQSGGISSREWTRKIKEGLCQLGKQNRYSVSAAGCVGADTGEWLFDLVWAKVEGNPQQFLEMPLAMECEWSVNYDDISWDFEKLLAAKAPNKLMVFQQASKKDVHDIIKNLNKMVDLFETKLPGERYLLAGYAFDDHELECEVV